MRKIVFALLVLTASHQNSSDVLFAQNFQLAVDGAPGFDSTMNTGYTGYLGFLPQVNRNGVAIMDTIAVLNGTDLGSRTLRWQYGVGGQELGTLGYSATGFAQSYGNSINDLGQVVGVVNPGVLSSGDRAVLWNGGVTPVALGDLGPGSAGTSGASAINNQGTIVGWVQMTNSELRAVRWSPGNLATPERLDGLGTDVNGRGLSNPNHINNQGITVGSSRKFDTAGTYLGDFAVRWNAGSSVAVELGTAPVVGINTSYSANKINDAGIAIGSGQEFNNIQLSQRAIRWNAAGNAETLANLNTSSGGDYYSQANNINEQGTAVGFGRAYHPGLTSYDSKAVRWNHSGTSVEELGNLAGIANPNSTAFDVNLAGLTVGQSWDLTDQTGDSFTATMWLRNGTAIDLNDLDVVPLNGGPGEWKLQSVTSIAANGWIAGIGSYDPDGINSGVASYTRGWVAQIGLGGVWVNPVPGGVGLWHEGRNWDSGTPALHSGLARFASPGNNRVALDDSVNTRRVDFESGNVMLDVAAYRLNVRDGLHIFQNARAAINTLFDPQHDLIGFVRGNIVNEGTLSPGNSPGLLNLIGNLVNTGSLEFEVTGIDPSEFDRLWISGNFDAGGTLKLLLAGYTPVVGDEFDLMDWGTLNYQGMSIDLSAALLATGLRWDTTDFSSTGTLRVSAIPEPCNLVWLIAVLYGFTVHRQRQTSVASVAVFN